MTTIPTRLLRERFRSSPRFGRTDDFSSLFSEDQDELNAYIVGLLVTSLLILSFCFGWSLVLVLLTATRSLGYNKTGFLSGAPFQATNKDGKTNLWIKRGRIVFGVSCLMFIVFVITLVTAGIGNLDTTTTTIGDGAKLGRDYLLDLQTLLHRILDIVASIQNAKETFLSELRSFYEALQQVEEAFVNETMPVREAVENLLGTVESMQDFLADPLQEINTTLTDRQETCEAIYTTTDIVDFTGLQIGLGMILSLIPALLLGYLFWNVYETKPNVLLSNFRDWILWPLFVVLVLACILFSCLVSVAGLLNGDFCNGGDDSSPDSTIIEIMDKKGTDPESFAYQSLVYIIRQCDLSALVPQYPLENVELFLNGLININFNAANATAQIRSTGIPTLINATGYNTTIIATLIVDFRPTVRELGKLTENFLAGALCQPLYEVYAKVTHEAACRDSYSGLFWMFMSLLLMSFFGLLAVTFRSALYPIEGMLGWDDAEATGVDAKANPMLVQPDVTVPLRTEDDQAIPNGLPEKFDDEHDKSESVISSGQSNSVSSSQSSSTSSSGEETDSTERAPKPTKQIDAELFVPKPYERNGHKRQQIDDLYFM